MGNDRFKYLLEKFKLGAVHHCDGLISDRKIIFSLVSKYLATSMKIFQTGSVFSSSTIHYHSEVDKVIKKINDRSIKDFGLRHSVAHTKIIKSAKDGEIYYLETYWRAAGAHLADMVPAFRHKSLERIFGY